MVPHFLIQSRELLKDFKSEATSEIERFLSYLEQCFAPPSAAVPAVLAVPEAATKPEVLEVPEVPEVTEVPENAEPTAPEGDVHPVGEGAENG